MPPLPLRSISPRVAPPVARARLLARVHGLDEAKARLLDYAYSTTAGRGAWPLPCLLGPMGSGKSHLARALAGALERPLSVIRIPALCGDGDWYGRRRGEPGAGPGCVVRALMQSGVKDPVILLEGLDAWRPDFRGDAYSSLAAAIDPQAEGPYLDSWLEAEPDLGKVVFLGTATMEEGIPPRMRDHLEILRLPGYDEPDKVELARRFLLPAARERVGLGAQDLSLEDKALELLIRRYTREAGVRQLKARLVRLARVCAGGPTAGSATATTSADGMKIHGGVSRMGVSRQGPGGMSRSGSKSRKEAAAPPAGPEAVLNALGPPPFPESRLPERVPPGQATGLALTPGGGEILFWECRLLSGRGRLQMTGRPGEALKEAGQLALTLARLRALDYGVDPVLFHRTDAHLHASAGGVPKDGPSAGLALLLALVSAMCRRALDPRIAFTGELSLAGRLLPVGGLAEKVLACRNAGMRGIVVPEENRAEVASLGEKRVRGMEFFFAGHVDAVLEKALPAGKTRRGRAPLREAKE